MKNDKTTRRRFLQWAAAGSAVVGSRTLPAASRSTAPEAHSPQADVARLADDSIQIEFDPRMRLRVGRPGEHLKNPWAAGDYLLLSDGKKINEFSLRSQHLSDVDGAHGQGRQLTVSGVSPAGIEKPSSLFCFNAIRALRCIGPAIATRLTSL